MPSVSLVRGGHEIDAAALADCMERNGLPRLSDLKQFTFGQSNPTYFLECADGSKLVLRKKPAGTIIVSAHAVEREYFVMKALYAVNFPVPKPLFLESTSAVLGTPFYIMEYLDGEIFTNPALPELSVAARQQVYSAAIGALVNLHSFGVEPLGLSTFAPAGDYYARQLLRLQEVSKLQALDAPALPHLDECLAWFRDNLPAARCAVIHGDYKLDNMVFKCDRITGVYRLQGVLDWEMSTIGHPLADLANICAAYWTPPSSGSWSGLLGLDLGFKDTGIPTEQELLEMYTELSGQPDVTLNLAFGKAFWFCKYAVIAQGVQARLARGVATSTNAASVGAMAPALMSMCHEAVAVARSGGSHALGCERARL